MDAALSNARYVNLTTFRKDGRAVGTPVWVTPMNGKLYVYTWGLAGKAKRIRATSKVRLAPSDIRGNVAGNWSEGTARIVAEPALAEAANRAIARKYGWQHHVVQLISWLQRRHHNRIVIEITA